MTSKEAINAYHIELLRAIVVAFASISTTRKNAEYILIKRGEQLFQMITQGSRDAETVDSAAATLANLCIGTDQRLLLWSAGTLNWAMAQGQLWLILKMIYDCPEPATDFVHFLFNQSGKKLLQQLEQSLSTTQVTTPVCLALIRKSSEQSKQVRDYFPTKQLIDMLSVNEPNRSRLLFIYKEVFSMVGLLCIHNQAFIESLNLQFYITIFQRLCQYEEPKLTRAGLGCLTNLSANEKALKLMVADKGMYILLQRTLENDHDKPQIIEYALKLISNSIMNQTLIMLISQPKYLIRLLFIWNTNQTNIAITNQIIKITKQMQSQSPKFIGLLIGCIQELETTNSQFDFISLYTINLQRNLGQQKLDYVGENLMFLSILSSNSKAISAKVAQYTLLKDICQQYIMEMKKKENVKRALQVVSCLPIEEMDFDSEAI